MELDVTASEAVMKEKVQEAWSIYGQVDVLVNNAAYIDGGIFEETELVPTQSFLWLFLTTKIVKHS